MGCLERPYQRGAAIRIEQSSSGCAATCRTATCRHSITGSNVKLPSASQCDRAIPFPPGRRTRGRSATKGQPVHRSGKLLAMSGRPRHRNFSRGSQTRIEAKAQFPNSRHPRVRRGLPEGYTWRENIANLTRHRFPKTRIRFTVQTRSPESLSKPDPHPNRHLGQGYSRVILTLREAGIWNFRSEIPLTLLWYLSGTPPRRSVLVLQRFRVSD